MAAILPLPLASLPFLDKKPFTNWSLEQAVAALNESPWAKQPTFTKVLGGVGSGILEKAPQGGGSKSWKRKKHKR